MIKKLITCFFAITMTLTFFVSGSLGASHIVLSNDTHYQDFSHIIDTIEKYNFESKDIAVKAELSKALLQYSNTSSVKTAYIVDVILQYIHQDLLYDYLVPNTSPYPETENPRDAMYTLHHEVWLRYRPYLSRKEVKDLYNALVMSEGLLFPAIPQTLDIDGIVYERIDFDPVDVTAYIGVIQPSEEHNGTFDDQRQPGMRTYGRPSISSHIDIEIDTPIAQQSTSIHNQFYTRGLQKSSVPDLSYINTILTVSYHHPHYDIFYTAYYQVSQDIWGVNVLDIAAQCDYTISCTIDPDIISLDKYLRNFPLYVLDGYAAILPQTSSWTKLTEKSILETLKEKEHVGFSYTNEYPDVQYQSTRGDRWIYLTHDEDTSLHEGGLGKPVIYVYDTQQRNNSVTV